jgi:hypothetical protein
VGEETKKAISKNKWNNQDMFLIGTIFYLLGLLTAIIIYLVLLFSNNNHVEDLVFRMKLYTTEAVSGNAEKHTQSKGTPQYSLSSNLNSNPITAHNVSTTKQELLTETTTVIRSALYQYIKQHGSMPSNLSVLTKPLPQNYLTSLPMEPIHLSSKVSDEKSNNGGWVYSPKEIKNIEPQDLKEIVKNALYPNVSEGQNIPFEPLEIYILKESNTLKVTAGDQLLRSYNVALGKNDSTPEGSFYINRKIMNPNKQISTLEQSPYGNRGLELSDPTYAIHGTNNPKTIGENVSKGCIRMLNNDIAELYAMASLYTPVNILSNSKDPQLYQSIAEMEPTWERAPSPTNSLLSYNQKSSVTEEDPSNVYSWAH